jgi:hydroxyethylthiazole kinase-like uncharacterized protein yjeF
MNWIYQPLARAEPVLTVDEIRAAEARTISEGTAESELMRRAGTAAADAIQAFIGRAPVLVLTGPGNNGGDGYVVARTLAGRGWNVSVAAPAPPKTEAARAAAAEWKQQVLPLAEAEPAPVLVDALFGTGLARALDEDVARELQRLAAGAETVVALDLPSGVDTDTGACLSEPARADLTVTFGALKPSHLLYPAASFSGRVVIADIGLGEVKGAASRIGRPELPQAGCDTNKYRRGHVAVIGGKMPGAAMLAARGAQAGGAGYVSLVAEGEVLPSSIVRRSMSDIAEARVDAVVIGPGLGREEKARARALQALGLGLPCVLDADLFSLFADEPERLYGRSDVMTPHEGEFVRYFGEIAGSKIERARAAASRSGNVVLLKGADTVVASPDGRVAISDHGSPKLATAGSGDVLSGLIAALIARGLPAFEAASAGAWLHGDAARRGRSNLVAEDLIGLIRA